MSFPVYTIGHSNYTVERFIELLRLHGIEAIGDVRSHPYSQYCPQFNREALERSLKSAGVRYAYFGAELGARTEDRRCYENGRVVYSRLAETEPFRAGIRRVVKAHESRRVALMCAEKDPLTCHRTILICRTLRSFVGEIAHILEDGGLEVQREAERRLMDQLGIVYPDLFHTEDELIEEAYEIQAARIAYEAPSE